MLADAQVTEFHERGFLKIAGFADADEVRALQQETDALHERMWAEAIEQGDPGLNTNHANGVGVSWEDVEGVHRIRQLMGSEHVCPTIEKLLHSERMVGAVRQLIGAERIIKYHSKLMMKAAGDGTFTPWHQDWGYWKSASREPSQVNCMLSIDAATLANGCIRFVEGSQKQGPIDHVSTRSASFSIGLEGGIADRASTAVETEPGDAVFFGSLVIHGSAANTSPHHRRANTFAFDRIGNLLNEDAQEMALVPVGA